MFLDDLGIDEPGSSLLIRESRIIEFSTFYRSKEVRAWTFKNGSKAPRAWALFILILKKDLLGQKS